jgi:hypothetical protein
MHARGLRVLDAQGEVPWADGVRLRLVQQVDVLVLAECEPEDDEVERVRRRHLAQP